MAEGRCSSALSPAQRQWLGLFGAVGARDPRAVHGPAAWILENDKELGAESRAYATLAAVSANLAIGRRAEAAAILQAQRSRLSETRLSSPAFRYLAASFTERELESVPSER